MTKLLLIPSVVFEGFPMVLQEAFAAGTPCAVSNLGPLPTLVREGEDGFVFEPRSANAIVALVHRVWGDEAALTRVSGRARGIYESQYTERINYQRLMTIYSFAIAQMRTEVA